MAKDPRRFVSFTLPEDQADWIEKHCGGPSTNKPDAIKEIIAAAMRDKSKKTSQETQGTAATHTQVTCSMKGSDATLRTLLATLEMFIQTYMADHPERPASSDLLATIDARWRSFIEYKRPEYMQKAGNNAP